MPRRWTPAVSRKQLAYYRAHILEALREEDVVCLECGHLYQGLANHLRLHGVTGQAYREKWGYNRGTALIPSAFYERLSQHAFDRNIPALRPPDAIRKALAAKQGPNPETRLEGRGRSRAAIQARLAAGWRPTDKLKKVTDETLRALVDQGLTFGEIAARTGTDYSGVHRRIRALA